MKKLFLLSYLSIFLFSCGDDTNLPADYYPIEGKWLWSYSENRIDANTMYEYLDGTIYTYYGDCTDIDPCNDLFWNSLDDSDRIPETDSYSYDGYSVIIDGIQEIVTFDCDGGKVYLENSGQYWRLSSDCQ